MNATRHNEPNTFRLFNGKEILKQRNLVVQLLFSVDVKQAAADN